MCVWVLGQQQNNIMHEDITEHVAYDRGFQAGQHDMNRIIALKEDLAYDKGYEAGKQFVQDKVLELMNEVISEYKLMQLRMEAPNADISKAQLNAAEFMKSWVLSGGVEGLDGNRTCLPW